MNKADAIDILENSSSAANLLQVFEIIEHYDEPATFTNTPLTVRELLAFSHKDMPETEFISP